MPTFPRFRFKLRPGTRRSALSFADGIVMLAGMSVPGLAHVQAPPGATTCVLIGGIGSPPPDLGAYRAAFWLVVDGAAAPSPRLAAGAALQRQSPADPAAVVAELDRFVRRDARQLPAVLITPEAAAHPESYDAALAGVVARLEAHHRARVTRQQDGFRWQQHVLRNLPAYARRPVPPTWRGALQGVPAVVCGAGPSLDVSLPRLAGRVGGTVILAADSALRPLARHGLRADVVVTVDVAKEPARCLAEALAPRHAVMAAVSPPAWNDALPDSPPLYLAGNQITTDWIAALGLAPPALAVTESCGVTALELARFLGCAPICLFGLDLALTPGATVQRHAAGMDAALYARSGFQAEQAHPEVPGNHTPTVPTHVIGDWRALDARLADWPAGLVVNVNDRGARLRNTTVVHPRDFDPPVGAAIPAAGLRLPPPAAGDAGIAAKAMAEVCRAGAIWADALPEIRRALATGGPAAVAARLRPLLAGVATGRVLGAYALKLMPHLLPPVAPDPMFWAGLLDELDALAALARDVR